MRSRPLHDLDFTSRVGRPACPRARYAGVAALLVLALLWAQMLGLVHGVRHFHVPLAPPAPSAQAMPAAHAHLTHAHAGHAQAVLAHAVRAHAVLAHDAPQSLLEHLAAPEGETQDCRLYDQLGHGGPVAAPLIAALTQASPLTPAWVVLQALQPRPCVAFAARAPPASR